MGKLRVAPGIGRRSELVLADPAELGGDGALGGTAAEERRDPDAIRL